jgi:hypothetical protein
MDPNLLQLLVCAGLTLLGLIITALLWPRARWRTVIFWLGLSLLPIAVYLVGLLPTLVDLWNTLALWYQGLTWTMLAMAGVAIGGLGVLLMIISRLLPHKPRAKKTPAASDSQVARQRPDYGSSPQGASTSSSTGATSADDPEVTEILKRRGID